MVRIVYCAGIITLTGCGTNDEDPYMFMEAYIIEKEDDTVLAVAPGSQDFSETGGVSEDYEAINFSGAGDDVLVGDYVKIEYDHVLTS
ncbi:hypothetical protein JSY36_10135 [Bacillus sp. H-16]|uniref:hypothetical protein n=1 Tax=Alteribacter salitolerans TaxID=2912333 RepID=UPI0019651494|nr:hypothetical protein [Alteribacter salitolerans]MBM7096115.1 hypothetical protein [Alteribacter salitolerans]